MSGVRYAFGVCIPAIALGLGVSLATVTVAVTVHWVTFTVTAPFAWRVFARIGTPLMILIGGVLSCMGMLLSAVSQNATMIALSFGVLVGLGTHGFGQMTAGAPLVGAPLASRDRYLGVIASGAPVGTAVYPSIAAIVVAVSGWRITLVVIGALVLAVTLTASSLLRGVPALPRALAASSDEGSRSIWRRGVFLLLAVAFFISLGTQIAVPLLMPVWAIEIGVSPQQLALAFIVLGASGLLGRLLLTSATGWFTLRLWVTVPATVLAVAGCVVAVLTKGAAGMYIAAALLGMSTPVFGALFTIAALACFSVALYPRVTGSILVPIGAGAAVTPLLMSAIIEHQDSTTLVWLAIAILISIATVFFLVAEATSPEHRARRLVEPLAPGDERGANAWE